MVLGDKQLAPAVHRDSLPAPARAACGATGRGDPMDFLFVAATVVFFAVSLAYVRGCDRL